MNTFYFHKLKKLKYDKIIEGCNYSLWCFEKGYFNDKLMNFKIIGIEEVNFETEYYCRKLLKTKRSITFSYYKTAELNKNAKVRYIL